MKKIFTLLCAALMSGAAFAQTIPNAGFETWTTSTTTPSYHIATGWDSPNSTTAGAPINVITCDSGTVSPAEGLAYLKLTSKTSLAGVIPGVAATGTINISIATSSYSVSGGFISTTRPQSLTGKFQHMDMSTGSTDHGRMVVMLWKRNASTHAIDTVAIADTTIVSAMAMSWTTFTVPFVYHSNTLTPDSAMVIMASSSSMTAATNGTFLYVDNLAFSGSVPTNGVVIVNNAAAAMEVYPNPATTNATVLYHSLNASTVAVNIADMSGRTIKSLSAKTITGDNNIAVSLKGIAQGIYIISVTDESGTIQKKLMVN